MRALRKLVAGLALLASVHATDARGLFYHRIETDGLDSVLAIVALGTIEKGDAQRLRDFLADLPPDARAMLAKGDRNSMFFNSDGGLIEEALLIAAILQDHHFVTGVTTDGMCKSACVLAWAVGTTKFVNPGSCVGVHSSDADVAKGTPDKVRQSLEGSYNLRMAVWLWDHGAPTIVTQKIFKTPSTGMYCLTPADLKLWGATMTGKP